MEKNIKNIVYEETKKGIRKAMKNGQDARF